MLLRQLSQLKQFVILQMELLYLPWLLVLLCMLHESNGTKYCNSGYENIVIRNNAPVTCSLVLLPGHYRSRHPEIPAP